MREEREIHGMIREVRQQIKELDIQEDQEEIDFLESQAYILRWVLEEVEVND